MPLMNIGDAAAAAGVSPKMIRHYESLALIPEAERSEAGYRLYGDREVAMLQFIRQSRSLGFSIEQINALMSLWRDPARQSSDVKQVALGQLAELEQRQRELDQMRSTLEGLVEQCRGDHTAHCAILETLARAPTRPLASADRGRARKALKQVRAGEPRPQGARRRRQMEAAPAVPGHAALSAWARSFS